MNFMAPASVHTWSVPLPSEFLCWPHGAATRFACIF